jgi:alpha-1,2-glucosyltransferase
MMSIILKQLFMLKCNLPMLRLIPALTLICLPIVTTRLIRFHQRLPPPDSLLAPDIEAFILSSFPLAFFFGFLYYTEVPSVLFVVATFAAATQGRHYLAALVRTLTVLRSLRPTEC